MAQRLLDWPASRGSGFLGLSSKLWVYARRFWFTLQRTQDSALSSSSGALPRRAATKTKTARANMCVRVSQHSWPLSINLEPLSISPGHTTITEVAAHTTVTEAAEHKPTPLLQVSAHTTITQHKPRPTARRPVYHVPDPNMRARQYTPVCTDVSTAARLYTSTHTYTHGRNSACVHV